MGGGEVGTNDGEREDCAAQERLKGKLQYPLILPHPVGNPDSCGTHPNAGGPRERAGATVSQYPGGEGTVAVASLTLQHPPSSTAGRAAQPPAQWKREEPGRLRRSRRCAKSGAGRAPSRRGRTRVSTLGSRACAPLRATDSPNEAQASRVAVLKTLLPSRSAENKPQNLEVGSSPDLGSLGARGVQRKSGTGTQIPGSGGEKREDS